MDATARDDEGPDWPLDEGPPPEDSHGNALGKALVARIVALRLQGLPLATIAERLGVHKDTAWWYTRPGASQPRLCVCCGRNLPGRRPSPASGEVRPGVCVECRPKRGLQVRGRVS